MSNKYVIFNKNFVSRPLYYIDKNGNSKVLEFNTKQEAQEYIELLLCEYENESFIVLSTDEWYQKIGEIEMEIEYSADLAEIISEISKEAKPIYDYYDNNINGFCLPIQVENNDEYIAVLGEKLSEFKEVIDKLAFHSETGLGEAVNCNCDLIISALQDLISEKLVDADKKVKRLLLKYIKNEFAVSDLEKSYAFRGISVYKDLYPNGIDKNFYKNMLEEELSFFRARVIQKNEKIDDIKDIISLPFSKRNLSKDLRFSVENEICLYLGVTSHVCFMECQCEIENRTKKNIYLSAFKFNSKGKKLKILNLVVSQSLINGIYQKISGESIRRKLQNTLIEIFPLVIATSFTVKDKDENRKKYEYLLSQSIIRAIKELGIDGVAYLSRRGKNDFQYPHGVNLAIPMKDIGESKEYSDLYSFISCTEPVLVTEKVFQYIGNRRSYINLCYPQYIFDTIENVTAQISYNGEKTFYGKTPYSKIDDYLLNQSFYELNSVVE